MMEGLDMVTTAGAFQEKSNIGGRIGGMVLIVLMHVTHSTKDIHYLSSIFCSNEKNYRKYVPRITQSLAGQVVVQVTCGSYHTVSQAKMPALLCCGTSFDSSKSLNDDNSFSLRVFLL
jgi:hypothetical protein